LLNVSDVMGYDSITQLNGEKAKETEIGLVVMSAHFWRRSKRIQKIREVGTVPSPGISAMTSRNELWPVMNLVKAAKW